MSGYGGGSVSRSQHGSGLDYEVFKSAMGHVSPEMYLNYFNQYLPAMLQVAEPGRKQASDLAAMQGQNLLQSFNADAGRRGLSGSGYHLFGKNAIRGGTAANINNAYLQFYMDALNRAAQQAYGTQQLQLGAHQPGLRQSAGSSWGMSGGGGGGSGGSAGSIIGD